MEEKKAVEASKNKNGRACNRRFLIRVIHRNGVSPSNRCAHKIVESKGSSFGVWCDGDCPFLKGIGVEILRRDTKEILDNKAIVINRRNHHIWG